MQKVGVRTHIHDLDTKTDIRSQPHTFYAWEKQLPYPLIWRLCVHSSHSKQCTVDKEVNLCYTMSPNALVNQQPVSYSLNLT